MGDPNFWIGAGIGALLGLILERILGRPLDQGWSWVRRKQRRERARVMAELSRRNSELIEFDDDLVYVHAFYAAGLQLTTRLMGELRLAQRWQELPPEFSQMSPGERVELLQQERREIAEDPSRWNESRMGLAALTHGRFEATDTPVYTLVFHPTDYAATRHTEKWWGEVMKRDDLVTLGREDLGHIYPGMSHSFGLNATVVTDDGQLILVRRSARISSGRPLTHISVNEGMQLSDLDASKAPDVVHALLRGVEEELGLRDVPRDSVLLHSLVLDATRYQWALLGHVDLRGTGIRFEDVDRARRAGQATDGWENDRVYGIPFTPEDVLKALKDRTSWIAHGWVNLVLSSVVAFPARSAEFQALLSPPSLSPSGTGSSTRGGRP